jgi:hypothetical protein
MNILFIINLGDDFSMVRDTEHRNAGFFEPVDIFIVTASAGFFVLISFLTAYTYGANHPYVIGGTYSVLDFINFWTAFGYSNWAVFLILWACIGSLFGLIIVFVMNYFRK